MFPYTSLPYVFQSMIMNYKKLTANAYNLLKIKKLEVHRCDPQSLVRSDLVLHLRRFV